MHDELAKSGVVGNPGLERTRLLIFSSPNSSTSFLLRMRWLQFQCRLADMYIVMYRVY